MRYSMQLTMATAIFAFPLYVLAETRTWTDHLGRTIQADFVRSANGQVVLLVNGSESSVPITQLSESDQQWIRDQANESDAGSDLPSDDKAADTDDDLSGLDAVQPTKLKSNRTWTERSGRKISAKFVRVHQGTVVLTQGNRIKTIAFQQFTESDQDYIKQLLRQQGEDTIADQLDRLSAQNALAANTSRPSAGQSNTGQPNMGRPNAGVPSFPTMPRPPTTFGPGASFDRMQQQMEESRRAMERRNQERQERARRDQEEAERRRQESNDRLEAMRREQEQQLQRDAKRRQQEAEQRQQEMQEQLAQNTSLPAYTPPTITPPNIPSAVPSTFTGPSASPVGPNEIDGYCGECGKDIPASIGAGDKCPHCGVYFEYEEDEDGTVTYADNSSGNSGFRLRRIPIKGIVTLVLIVLGGIAAVGKRILGS